MNQEHCVFISYRRSDGTEFAKRIHDDLEAAGIDAWLDICDMPSGDTFIAHIERAIERADYFLLVATPQATESDYCRDEWKKALEKYKPIIPLMLTGDYADLPKEAFVYLNDARDFRNETLYTQQVIQLIRQIQILPSRSGETNGVPNLPFHYLVRAEILDHLRELLTKHKTTVLTSFSAKIGVQGMGGVGKSVLAAAITKDYFIRRTFKDGIFWLTFGTAPRLHELWQRLAGCLGHPHKSFGDIKDAQDFFEEETRNKEYLIILDDLWQGDHANAFLHLGEKCRVFATSRQSSVLTEIGAYTYPIGVLSDTEAHELLKRAARTDTLPETADSIIQACGNLPLALSMIGAMVAEKPPSYWQDALEALSAADLEEISVRFPDYPYPNLFAALKVSIAALNPELRELYFDFAVFPEDISIPEQAIYTFWKPRTEREARKKINELVDRSLLGWMTDNSLSIHDLQLSYLRKETVDIPVRHQRLLDQYNPNNEPWYRVCDEYLWQNLSYHLSNLERLEELFQAVTDSPDWMQKKFIACKGNGEYLADIEILLSNFQVPLKANNIIKIAKLTAAKHVVLQISNKYEDMDLQILVWLGREKEAIEYTDLRGDISEKLAGQLTVLNALFLRSPKSGYLDELLKEIVLQLRNSIGAHGGIYASTANALIRANHFQEAYDIALSYNESRYSWRKSELLSTVANRLATENAINYAQQLLDHIDSVWDKDRTLFHVSLALARKNHLLSESIKCINAISQLEVKLRAVADIVEIKGVSEQLENTTDLIQLAKTLIQNTDKKRFIVREIAYLARKLSRFAELREEAIHFIDFIIDLQPKLEGSMWIPEAMSDVAVAYYLLNQTDKANKALSLALSLVKKIPVRSEEEFKDIDEQHRVDALKSILWRCIEIDQIDFAESIINGIKFPRDRIEMLCELAFRLNEQLPAKAKDLLADAEALSETLTSAYDTRKSFQYIGLTYARLGYLELASNMLEKIIELRDNNEDYGTQLTSMHDKSLRKIGTTLCKFGSSQQAYKLSHLISSPDQRTDYLCKIALFNTSIEFSKKILVEADSLLEEIGNPEISSDMQKSVLYTRKKLGLEEATKEEIEQDLIGQIRHMFWVSNYQNLSELISRLEPSVEKAILLCNFIRSKVDTSLDTDYVSNIESMLNHIKNNEISVRSINKNLELIEGLHWAGINTDLKEMLNHTFELVEKLEGEKDLSNVYERIARVALITKNPEIVEKILVSDRNILNRSEVNIFCRLAVYYFEHKYPERCQAFLERAKKKIEQLDTRNPELKGEVLQSYCWALASAQRHNEAIEIARTISHQNSHDQALVNVVWSLLQNKKPALSKASKLVEEIKDEHQRARTLGVIAKKYFEANKLEVSIEIMNRKELNQYWAQEIINFAEYIFKAGKLDEANKLFQHALILARTMDNHQRRVSIDTLLSTFIENRLYTEFFNTLRGQVVDVFIDIIAEYAEAFDTEDSIISVAILRETIRIAAWIQPFWKQVNEVLNDT